MREIRIDRIRGVAVLIMVPYHVLFDLQTYCQEAIGGPLRIPEAFWRWMPMLIGAAFLFAVGLSCASRADRAFSARAEARIFGRLLLVALGLSVATYPLLRERPIYFGILHSIAFVRPLTALAIRARLPLLLGAALLLPAGAAFLISPHPVGALFWLAQTDAFPMADYYPLLPWIGFPLIGAWVGLRNRPPETLRAAGPPPGGVTRATAWLGRHSLAIYLAHQPAIIGILSLAGYARF